MKKKLTNSLRVSLFIVTILSAAPSAFCQFWVLSGSNSIVNNESFDRRPCSGTGQVSYSEKFTGINRLGQSDSLEIDLKSIAKGKYILEIQYDNSRDFHHLIIE